MPGSCGLRRSIAAVTCVTRKRPLRRICWGRSGLPTRLWTISRGGLAGRADAAIVNVTSGLAFVPLVATATYCATKAAMHSYTVSLREALKGKVEVIELAPPAVQTRLTPGQESREGYQPLDAFADEVMTIFGRQPTSAEILVERVGFLRFAEAQGRFEATLKQVNSHG